MTWEVDAREGTGLNRFKQVETILKLHVQPLAPDVIPPGPHRPHRESSPHGLRGFQRQVRRQPRAVAEVRLQVGAGVQADLAELAVNGLVEGNICRKPWCFDMVFYRPNVGSCKCSHMIQFCQPGFLGRKLGKSSKLVIFEKSINCNLFDR